MATSDNNRVSFLIRFMANDARSITGKNLSCISSHFSVNVKELPNYVKLRTVLQEEDMQKVMMIKELKEILRGKAYLPGFERDEINDMIMDLCCN